MRTTIINDVNCPRCNGRDTTTFITRYSEYIECDGCGFHYLKRCHND